MKNGKSYLQQELVMLRLKTNFLAMLVILIPLLKSRCSVWFMKNSDFLLDYAENGLLNSENKKQISSIGELAKRFDESCYWWCEHIIECSDIIEFEYNHR
ncbi:hypothetical protein FT976_21800 [Salmonella enterica]|nr:hypothetical protein [Salmonella enterica]